MGKVDKVLVEIAKLDTVNEAIVFELCDLYELNYLEEVQVLDMYRKSIGIDAQLSVNEALAKPEMLRVPDVYAPKNITMSHSFGKVD